MQPMQTTTGAPPQLRAQARPAVQTVQKQVQKPSRQPAPSARPKDQMRFLGRPERCRSLAPAVGHGMPLSARLCVQEGSAFKGHCALLCEDLKRSLKFYQDVLGLEVNPDRPHDKLPYAGAWLWVGPEMIHLLQLPNPCSAAQGGRERCFCTSVNDLQPLIDRLESACIEYTKSMTGQAAIQFKDPDMNLIEVFELQASQS